MEERLKTKPVSINVQVGCIIIVVQGKKGTAKEETYDCEFLEPLALPPDLPPPVIVNVVCWGERVENEYGWVMRTGSARTRHVDGLDGWLWVGSWVVVVRIERWRRKKLEVGRGVRSYVVFACERNHETESARAGSDLALSPNRLCCGRQ